MIFAEKVSPDEEIFLRILENSKTDLVSKLRSKRPLPNSSEFETLVCSVMIEQAVGTEFEGTIRQTRAAAFPDIVANGYFGVEVKMTSQDHWHSIGNSVLESSRMDDVEKIYILFGKIGGVPDVKYRLYQECLPDISVTHYPRYRIDMDLPEGESIFDKMEIPYDKLRTSNDSIQWIKSYYRSRLKEGEGLWWINDEIEVSSPVIRQFRTLEPEEKERFRIDCMILFPELFKSSANYDRAATYLITEFGAVHASLRDAFTAGGKEERMIIRENKSVSQMHSKLHDYAEVIARRIEEMDEELLKFYWGVDSIEEDRIKQWEELMDAQASPGFAGNLPSEVFQSGYEKANKERA